jgi:NAD(P)-dependent dehydrogenase (short-subunit alcohol dehydrogenase family)
MESSGDMFPHGAAVVFGATGGIGQHVAMALARAGTDVAIMWRSKDELADKLAKDIRAIGRKASTHQCDVTEQGAVRAAIDDVIKQHSRIHTAVWAAGPLVEQVFLADVSDAQWNKAVGIEVNGFFKVARTLIPHMRENGGGSFVHLGSAGDLSWPDKDILSVAPKAANESLIKGIAREEGKYNIRANSILVGVIEAGMFLELTKQGVFDDAWVSEVHKNLALKRWGQPEEVGHAAVFLASNNAAYVTGQQISVAGGYGL